MTPEARPTSRVVDDAAQAAGPVVDAVTIRAPAGLAESDVFNEGKEAPPAQRGSVRFYHGPESADAYAARVASMRSVLTEFFRINGIDPGRGEQIVQELVELDTEMMARTLEIEATLATDAPGITSGAALFENEEFLRLEEERIARKRDIFGALYDAYREYKATYQHQAVLNTFSSSLNTPLNIATREELLRVLIEEAPQLPDPHESSTAPDEVSVAMQSRLNAIRARNEAVKRRARSYLTPDEFELFAETLEVEAERMELSLKMLELSYR